MALEMMKTTNGQGTDRDTVFLMGGVAMLLLGTGLVLTNPVIRRYFSELGVGNLFQNVMPDVERYLKLRAM